MNIMPNFTLRPIKTIMQDANLKLKLIETHLDKAFADVFFDDLEDDIREQEFFPELRETIVDAAASTDDPFTAFMHLKNDGWHSGGRELTAFEELFRLMDLDRFELLKMRAKQMGYGGPFGKKAFLFKEYGSDEIMLGFQPDELLPECEFASVFFEDGLPDRDNEGKLLMMIGRWTEVSSIEGEITDENLLNELKEAFQEKRDELLLLEGEAFEYETDIDDYLSSSSTASKLSSMTKYLRRRPTTNLNASKKEGCAPSYGIARP